MAKDSLTDQAARVTSAVAGVQKYFSTTASLVLAGTTYTPAQLIALLQAFATAIAGLTALHAQLSSGVLAVRGQQKQVNKILLALEAYVDNLFGSDPTKLADFGFVPKKVGVVTAATRVKAQAKAKATREARHTLGKKQKAAITGESPASTPTVEAPAVTNGTTVKS
jgi:hypothetical protein